MYVNEVTKAIQKSHVVALTQGDLVPSTRFRWRQYEPDFTAAGLIISEYSSLFCAYAPYSKWVRPFWLGSTLLESLWRIIKSANCDVYYLQRNLVASLYTWEGLLKKPIVFDVDDAIFLGPRGNSANKIAQRAEIIVCGNSYLANHFERLGKVEILPTAVDSERYKPKYVAGSDEIVIGWSGTSGGFEYLYDIEESLSQVLKARPKAVLKIVSDRRPNFKLIPEEQFRYEAWTATSEVQALQRFSIGIMPLADDPWSRGKCSFKMLTYMAVGIPVVVSPVGMNIEILNKGTCGLAASSLNEWVETLIHLIDDEGNRRRMGSIGRDILEKYYSRKVIGPRLAEIISSVAR